MMTELEQLRAQIAAMQAENAALKQAAQSKLSFKVSEKGAVSIYGMGRFPATLYAGQWLTVLDNAERLKAFIMANHSHLATKAPAKASLASFNAAADEAGIAR